MAARTAVVAGTATAVSGRVQRRQAERWQTQEDAAAYQEQQQYQQYAPPPPPATPAPAAPAEPDANAQLHNQGVLTDEEFAAAKAKILGI